MTERSWRDAVNEEQQSIELEQDMWEAADDSDWSTLMLADETVRSRYTAIDWDD